MAALAELQAITRALTPRVTNWSSTARATVSPPKPESKMPIGASATRRQPRTVPARSGVDAAHATREPPHVRLERQLGLRRPMRRVDAVEPATHRLTSVDPAHRLGEEPGH